MNSLQHAVFNSWRSRIRLID